MRLGMPGWAVSRDARWGSAIGRAAVALVAALVVASCSAPVSPSASPGPSGSDDPAVAAFPRCSDVPNIEAPAAWYGPEPVYVANEMPVEELRAWALEDPGFQELWIDRDHQGWVTLGFTGDVEARQAALLEAFPGVGVVAVQVSRTAAELEALQGRVGAAMRELGIEATGAQVNRGIVEVAFPVLEPELVAALAERFPGTPICVDGLDPADAPSRGPQAASGDGWRLLGHEAGVGQGYRTGIATSPAQLAALWAEAGLRGEPPAVDFHTEVAIWFGAVTGSSCPDLRLDGVSSDPARSLVWADITLLSLGGCTADIYPHAFVVAVRRDRLPAAPLGIQLGPDDPPAGAPEERTIVDAPVQLPGVVAEDEDIHPDPELLRPDPVVAEPGDIVEPGFEPTFRFPVVCGVEWVGPLNGTWWRTKDPAVAGGAMPDAWADAVDDQDDVVASISIRTDPAEMDVTIAEVTLTYTAVAGAPTCR